VYISPSARDKEEENVIYLFFVITSWVLILVTHKIPIHFIQEKKRGSQYIYVEKE